MPSNEDVLKALVDESLGRSDTHPDRRSVLEEWREDNLSDEEKDARKTDDDRAREEAEQDEDKARRESDIPARDEQTRQERQDARRKSDADSETDREGPENRPEQDTADTTAPETGKPSTRKAGK